MKKKGTNSFTNLLNALEVKHTLKFSNKYFNEHPHKYNLFGLSSILSDYGISNGGTKIEDKLNDIQNIQTPFVAHIGGEFAIVYNITAEKVDYRVAQHNISVTREKFCELWTGVILLAEKNSNSIEPDYKRNKGNARLQSTLKLFFLSGGSLVLIFQLYNSLVVYDLGLSFSFLINLVGAYIGFLLVQKQLEIHSSYSDKICSLFKQTDCNRILESDAAMLWKTFNWSDIGFSYFLSNLIIVAFFPNLINYYALINICVLPYTFWSIWYQKSKAKQWCVLCLIVQALLWGIFIINLNFNYINFSDLSLINIAILLFVYSITFAAIALLTPLLKHQSKNENIIQEINSLKAHEGILSLLLKEQPYYSCGKSTSKILFGNPEASILVTILSNPHCNPCSKLHTRIENMLKTGQQNLCIQYIFSSFNESLDVSNKFLIAAYLNSNKKDMFEIYNQWFTGSNQNKEKFFSLFPFDLNEEQVEKEFERHDNWKSKTKLLSTPTILVNGYLLPKNYQIEDLRFIAEL